MCDGVLADDFDVFSPHASTQAVFKEGWSAAAVGDQAALTKAIDALQAADPQTPLLPYLKFEAMRQKIAHVQELEMSQFLARHRDWSFHDALERAWLKSLGRQQRSAVIERYLTQTGQRPMDDEIHCYVVSHNVKSPPSPSDERYAALMADIQSLWLRGESQHKACDAAFAWWRNQSQPTLDVAWQRFRLAIDQNQRSLASYLQRYLSDDQRIWASRWLLMARYPHRVLSEARRWPDNGEAHALIEWGLMRMARGDWQRAQGHWQRLQTSFSWSNTKVTRIQHQIALFHALSLDVTALTTIDAVPVDGRDAQLLAWRARVAMANERWDEVLASIEAMPLSEQASGRWQYWRGRALAKLGRPDAILAYALISGEANYYGFLAAKKLGQPLSLCPETLVVDEAIQATFKDDPVLIRALALYRVGLLDHARWTWLRWLSHLPEAHQQQAAWLAAELGWHDRAIATLASTGNMRAYDLRFPMLYEEAVMEASQRHGVDPALVYGLMRAESAMQPDARSPVGALGLLQLMPSTAQAVARRMGQSLESENALHEPDKNIELGVAHLGELETRFQGDWRLVAAAYNAGANAVDRWLNRPGLSPSMPADVWIETLPYFETRDYVPRVLAFATLYEWQLAREPKLLQQHVAGSSATGSGAPSGFVCTAP